MKKANIESREITNDLTKEHLDHLVLFFMPLAYATAKRYRGRGAEFDDLAQTAVLGLYHYIPRFEGDCEDREALKKFLESRLPGYVRYAAWKRWRWYDCTVCTDDVEETLCDLHCEHEAERLELQCRMEAVLDEEELQFVEERRNGRTLGEIAESKGVNKSTICRYQGEIREKLHSVLYGLE